MEANVLSENKSHAATKLQPCGISCSLKGPEPVTYAHNQKRSAGIFIWKVK